MKTLKSILALATSFCLTTGIFSALSVNSTAYYEGEDDWLRFTADQGFSAEQIANSEVKPVITATQKVITLDEAKNAQTIEISVNGADAKYAATGVHVYFDERLNVEKNPFGKAEVSYGAAAKYLDSKKITDDPTSPNGMQGMFACTAAEDDTGLDGIWFSFNVTLPADAAEGDVYPIDILYKSSMTNEDLFVNVAKDEAGRLMQAYTFTQGIYNRDTNNNFKASAADVAKCAALAEIKGEYDGYIAIADGDGKPTEEINENKVNYVKLSPGSFHSAAIMEDGSLYTWGGSSLVPVKIMDNVKYVDLDGAAITEDSSLYTWGDNYYGQLGNGTTEDSLVPVKIMDNVKHVDVCGVFGAAITEDGSLYTWGNNYYGQLGNGTTEDSLVPVKIMDNVKYVDISGMCCVAITEDGSLYIWGYDQDGTTEYGLVPVKIMDNVKSINYGVDSYAVITEDGSLYTWGLNFAGQLGNGTTDYSYEYSLVPVKILDNVKSVASCSTHNTGSGLPHGDYGNYYNAAITEDGSLYMWGNNCYGQLGNGTKEDSLVPVKIMDNVKSVDLHDDKSSAITEDGQLYTWGLNDNTSSMFYDETAECNLVPVKIMDNVKSASVGYFSAALTEDNKLYTWGSDFNFQFGNGIINKNVVPVKIMNNVEEIWTINDIPFDISDLCIVAKTKDGSIYTAGHNYYGQLGIGTTEDFSNLTKIPFANSTTTPPTTGTDVEVSRLGDANCDGQITIADSTAILQALGNPDKYGLSAEGAANADCCNPGDGVTTSDALAIQKLDAKILVSLPEIIK